jgi:nucleoid-associated protein Lsr2
VAKETITKLIDDLDGGEAHETVKFGLDGHSYEIDLSTKNATKLRNALAPYVENGTRLSGRSYVTIGRPSAGRARGGAVGEREQNKAIRAWALRKGLDVAPRGRIKQEIVDQYHREAGR